MKVNKMPRQLPAWQLQALAAYKRDTELRKTEELNKIAQYFEKSTRASKQHEQWTTQDYYERANKDVELLNEKKTKSAKLQERRKKLELLLFQENMQLQEELKNLTSKPKLFKNGSFLNNVPTSALENINQGIREKEEELRRHEAELRLHHAWRAKQPELRAAESYMRTNRCKSAWMEQIIEKEMQKQKEEEETRCIIRERDESIRRQIQIEEERLKEKEHKMKELKSCLEDQIAELSDKEKAVVILRKQEEQQRIILDQLKFLADERVKQHEKLALEQKTVLINMGLHKYKLKQKVKAVLMEIGLDMQMLERIKLTVLKDYNEEIEKAPFYKHLLDDAYMQLQEHREREALRQASIEALYDGEARLMAEKQDKLWLKEREARSILMQEVLSTLQHQVEEKIEMNRQRQKENVLEREQILNQVDEYHREVRAKEKETHQQNAEYSNINLLQSELNKLKIQKEQLDEKKAMEASLRESIAQEEKLRKELVKIHREGVSDLPTRRKVAW